MRHPFSPRAPFSARPVPILCFLAALSIGCQFDKGGVTASDAGGTADAPPTIDGPPGVADAMPGTPDGPPGTPDAMLPDAMDPFCGWGYDPVHFDPCNDPPEPLNPLVLDMPGVYEYDTGNGGVLTDPNGDPVMHDNSRPNNLRLVWASSVTIASGTTLRVFGNRPMVLASKSNLDVQGNIDASSYWDNGEGDFSIGADAEPEPSACNTAGNGETCEHGGAGGGGGGFGGNGGNGGEGSNNRDCAGGQNVSSVGGLGGDMLAAPNTNLHGGCFGGDGGDRDSETFGVGGPGGGAFHLTAGEMLTIAGRVHANGAGGRGSSGDRAAGGGGGSGGMIGLEASTLTLQSTAVLSANGGGGGGGAGGGGGDSGSPGQDAPDTGVQATGGLGDPGDGGDGGDGGWDSQHNGMPGINAPDRGGGGGGGSAGYIILYNNVTPNGTAMAVSPAPIPAP